jgi:hypothetical protein
VCFTGILSNFQSDNVSFVDAPISDIMIPNVERSIEGDNLLVSNGINLGCIDQCTVKIRKTDSSNILAFKFSPSLLQKILSTWIACGHFGIKARKSKVKSNLMVDANVVITSKVSDPSKGMVEWIDQESKPFDCISLKSFTPKNQLKKIKYTFDLTLCDDIFDILLGHNIIKLSGHKVIPSLQDLEGRVYCKWHNSFDHSTSNCNAFCLVIQSVIVKGQLRFAYIHKYDLLSPIDHDDKILSNRQSQINSCKIEDLNVQNASSVISEDTLSTGGHKKITHMVHDRLETNRLISKFSAFKSVAPTGQTGVTPVTLIYTRPIRPVGHTSQTGLHNQVRQVSTEKVYTLESSHDHGTKGGDGHDKCKGKKSKLTFNELMVKYMKMRDTRIASQPSSVKPSRSPSRRKSKKWNCQGNMSHTLMPYPPMVLITSMPYGPSPTSFHPYPSWSWYGTWAQPLSYYAPCHFENATPKRPQPHVKSHFDETNQPIF